MRWLLVLAIAAVFGSISCAEDEEEADNSEEDTTYLLDDDEESDPDPAVDSNDPNLDDDDEGPDDTNQDFGLGEVQSDSRQKSGLDDLSSLPASKSQLKSSTLDKKSEGAIDDPTINSSVNEPENDSTEENSLNQGFFEEGFGNDNSLLRSQTQSEDISNLFGGLLGNSLASGLKNNRVQSLGGISQNGGESKLNGDLSSLIAGILGSSIPKSTLSNGLHRGVGNIRNSVLDFRDRALDQRVGTAQRGELNQFDPRFQASLSNPSNRGSTGVDQLTWNSLRNLINNFQQSSPVVQQNNQGTKSVKNGVFGLLGSAKGAFTANKGSEESINNSGTRKDEDSNQSVKSRLLGLLGNAVSNKETHNENNSSNRGGRFRFLSDAKNFVVNPVDFVERKIRNKIKQKIKNEIKQSVDDVTKRVDNFKSNMTSLASGLADSFQTKPSIKRSKNCLKILTGPQAHHLYLNGKQIPKARIFYVDKLQPLDFNSCPINHQDEVLKNCLLKGNVLVLSQPDRVKVEEEHGRQLEMIIAKDVVKDRLNSMVDTFFQNFGRQFLKGMHIFRGDKNE
ncbi:hypothetical protein LSTR_LSTR015624 [Laodelphax striatellus]|uniref:Uncharacterized protein n=1 Tax=Laodelphax striatellus TaxID=195883 RepID=A0A482XS71_LAOST|nr:hypothetical protein LSTR_LSTR009695 [Laodelphax striatellus]RZF48417.1 hypothetical protein LSTR_LSTR015624 [Laodelphax striatellus]